jgi:hypothetical protein
MSYLVVNFVRLKRVLRKDTKQTKNLMLRGKLTLLFLESTGNNIGSTQLPGSVRERARKEEERHVHVLK